MKKIRIGTRGSRLALAQAEEAARAFAQKGVGSEIVTVRTRGDADMASSLSEIGRGAFTDVFSKMLESGEIDVAVHSAKDLPTGEDKDDFFCLPRADARDVLLVGKDVRALRVGTGSPRRGAAVKKLYPSAEILPVRGNVDTRIRKMLAGEYDAVVLAAAGLIRLGILRVSGESASLCIEKKENGVFLPDEVNVRILPPETCVPAACQGIIALEGSVGALVGDALTLRAAQIERKLQRALGGDCTGGAGAYYDGMTLFAQKDGKVMSARYEGEKSIIRLAEKFR